MKERRMRCAACGTRFTAVCIERERISAYSDLCRTDRRREQIRARSRCMRARQRVLGLPGEDGMDA
jgi:hypothetical protein